MAMLSAERVLLLRKAAYAFFTGPIIGGYGALLLAGMISKIFSARFVRAADTRKIF